MKTKTECKHGGDIFPKDSRPDIHKDPLIGWVVAVRCGKCGLTGVAPVDCKNIDWDEQPKWNTNEELVKKYGPFKLIDRARENDLVAASKWRNILSIISYEVPYNDLPEDERPSQEELDERQESKESFTGTHLMASVGRHVVNSEHSFETSKPLDATFEILDFYFDDFFQAP